MATLVKIRGLQRRESGDAGPMKGRGLRLPSPLGLAYDGPGSVKATKNMTANTVTYTAVAGGTWANGILITHVASGTVPVVAVTYATAGSAVPTITVTAPATATVAANQAVCNAVNADPVAGSLVTCSLLGTGAAAHTAGSNQALAGGADNTSGTLGRTLDIRTAQSTVVVDVDNPKVSQVLRRSVGNYVSLGAQ